MQMIHTLLCSQFLLVYFLLFGSWLFCTLYYWNLLSDKQCFVLDLSGLTPAFNTDNIWNAHFCLKSYYYLSYNKFPKMFTGADDANIYFNAPGTLNRIAFQKNQTGL